MDPFGAAAQKGKKDEEKEAEGEEDDEGGGGIVAKAVPVLCLSRLCLKLNEKQGSAPKGLMTYAFTHMVNFLLLCLLLLLLLRLSPPQIPVSRPKF